MADGFSGMAELLADLRKLPEELKGEASTHVHSAASGMAADVTRKYDERRYTGNLSKGVRIIPESSLKVRVRSTAPHVHLFEFGSYKSGERFWKNPPKSTGTMPAQPTFIPAAVRHRKRMYERLQAMLKRVRVRGMTGSA